MIEYWKAIALKNEKNKYKISKKKERNENKNYETYTQSSIQEMNRKETSTWKDEGGILSCSAYSVIPELEVWKNNL